MENKKKEIEVRELAEQFFEEAVNQLDDQERKEEVEAERETYIGVWMRGYRAGEAAPAAGREEDAAFAMLNYIQDELFRGSDRINGILVGDIYRAFKQHNP